VDFFDSAHEEHCIDTDRLNTITLLYPIVMSVDKPTGIEYKLCAECQYSVPRNELVDGECVYCVHDLPNPMWK
jgi:hypothetical protein